MVAVTIGISPDGGNAWSVTPVTCRRSHDIVP
jgi:hypothetical protein